MAKWKVININFIVTLSSVLYIILITATGLDIVFLQSLAKSEPLQTCPHCPNFLLIQTLKTGVLAGLLINNVILILTAKKVSRTVLLTTMLTYYILGVLRNILACWNVFARMENVNTLSPLMRLEIHPLSLFLQGLWATMTFQATFVWFLGFGWKQKIIRGTDKIFRVKIRMILYIQVVFMLMHAIPLTMEKTKLILNVESRNKITSKDPTYFVSSSINLIFGNLMPFWYIFDVILGLRKNSYEKLRRFHRMAMIVSPLYSPIQLVILVQGKHIFDSDFVLWKYVIANILPGYVMCVYVLLFIYYKHLKHPEAEHNSGDNNKSIHLKTSQFSVKTISRNRLNIDNHVLIGSGHSSTVYAGVLQTSGTIPWKKYENAVAIKVLSVSNHNPEFVSVVAEELRNMSRAMNQSEMHPHLVAFYGACFQNSNKTEPPFGVINIVMELCENGSLDIFLLKLNEDLATKGGEVTNDCVSQLYSWAEQVAKGMEFLAQQNIIHGDLAARNILLDGKLAAKISDFGMSRKLYEYQCYVSTQQAVFPWKWMAPETLDGLKFSSASDVWSYGVLLWELFSIGTSPWLDKSWSSDFLARLMAGDRLAKPIFASDNAYKIMSDCWETRAEDRPTFLDLLKRLRS